MFSELDIMADSPIRRLSTTSSNNSLKREEDLINAYEAEEERIINVLSRKLEQVCKGTSFSLKVAYSTYVVHSFVKRKFNLKTRSRQSRNLM
jgi:hypothetical protein